MIDFTPFRSVDIKTTKKSVKYSIDTIRTVIRKRSFLKYIKEKTFSINSIKKHSKISINAKRQLWNKEVTSLQQIKMIDFQNLFISTPYKINITSDYKKALLTAFGLFQYTKPLTHKAKYELAELFNKFKVSSYDFVIDFDREINIEKLSKFGTIFQFLNTFYINNPLRFKNISKIKYYDKALQLKEQQGIILPEQIYRLELTIKTNVKLKDMFVPTEEIKEIINYIS